MKRLATLGLLVALAACSESKPEHYYVLCDAKDYNGWNLTNTEYEGGYLMACTYTSPERDESYTNRCRENGCD